MRKVEIEKDFKERISKGIPPTQQDVDDFQKILDDHSIIVKVIAGAMKKGVDTAPFEKTRDRLEWQWKEITRYDTRGYLVMEDFKKTIVVDVVYFLNNEYPLERDGGVAYNYFAKTMRCKQLYTLIYRSVDEEKDEILDFLEEVIAETIDEAFRQKKETSKPQPQPKKLPTVAKQEPKKNHKALVVDESIEVESSIPPFLGVDTIMKIVEMLKRQHIIDLLQN